MSNMKIKTSAIAVLTVVVILFSGTAFAQNFGNPLSGVIPGTGYGGGTRFNQDNRAIDTLVGIAIGGFLGYMIGNSQAQNQDNHYDNNRNWDQGRNNSHYNPNTRNHDNSRHSEYNQNNGYRPAPWDR
jgi:hypothetical protein